MYMHAEQQRRDREHYAILTGVREQVLKGTAAISQQLSVLVGPSLADSQAAIHGHDQHSGRAVHTSRMTRKKKDRPDFRICFRFPSWLSNRIWKVAIVRAQGGLTLEIRTWNIVPNDSVVFRHCRMGNLAGLQRLIGSGQASPLDATYPSLSIEDCPQNLLTVS